jgi:hypothetical protein
MVRTPACCGALRNVSVAIAHPNGHANDTPLRQVPALSCSAPLTHTATRGPPHRYSRMGSTCGGPIASGAVENSRARIAIWWGRRAPYPIHRPPRRGDVTAAQPATYDRWVRGQLLFPHVKGSPQSPHQPTKSSALYVSFRIVPLCRRLVSSPLLHLLLTAPLIGRRARRKPAPDPRGEVKRHRTLRAMGSLGGEFSDGGVRPADGSGRGGELFHRG